MPRKRLKERLLVSVAVVTLALFGIAGCAPQQASEQKTTDAPENAQCLAGAHKDQDTTCISCHTDDKKLSTVHENANSPSTITALKKTDVSNEACLACHTSFEEVAAKTADVVITDSGGKSVNPHALPESTSHAEVTCTSCHVSHVPSDTHAEARSTCLSCHHTDVFECGTCHS